MKNKVGILSLLILLQGCTSSFEKKYDPKGLMTGEGTTPTDTDSSKQRPFIKYDTAFLGKKVNYNPKTQAILAKEVNIHSYEATDLKTLMNTISEQTGISFTINNAIPGTSQAMSMVPGTGAENTSADENAHNVNFKGTFEEFMRYISSVYDVNASLDDNNVLKLTMYETYAIKLDFYGENNKSESGLDLSGNSSTSSGGLKGKSETKFESSFWDDVKDMADKNISSKVYTIFKDASILTFAGRPSEHRVLSEVLKKYQTDNNKQFVVTYKVFSLDKSKIKNLSGGATVQYNDGGTSFDIKSSSILKSMTSGMAIDRDFYAPNTGHALNINAQIDALYQLTGGKAIQSGSFVTRNNMPIPLNMTQSQYYVSGVTQTTNDLTSVQDSSVETTELVTGTSFIITPRVLSDGRIEVTSGFTKRYLNEIQDFGSVQLPKVTTSEMFNTSMVSSGSLLIVGKYEAVEQSDGQSYMMLGAGVDSSDNTVTIVTVVGIDYYKAPYAEK